MSMHFNPQPKPVKRRTVKAKRKAVKRANIADVRWRVLRRELSSCRVPHCLYLTVELAHLRARGMGGNPDLSRDTTANTIACCKWHHRGNRSLHSGHIKVRALTYEGADGPLCFEFYEQLPTEIK